LKKIKKFATIDIGSNAIRLLISNVIVRDNFPTETTKNALVRVPIRLGQDAFTSGIISEKNISRLIDSMKAFKLLMKVHKVEKYLAYATSALRSSKNGLNILKRLNLNQVFRLKLLMVKKKVL